MGEDRNHCKENHKQKLLHKTVSSKSLDFSSISPRLRISTNNGKIHARSTREFSPRHTWLLSQIKWLCCKRHCDSCGLDCASLTSVSLSAKGSRDVKKLTALKIVWLFS